MFCMCCLNSDCCSLQELVTNSCRDEDERGEAYQGELCDRVFGTEGVAMRKGDHVGLFHRPRIRGSQVF